MNYDQRYIVTGEEYNRLMRLSDDLASVTVERDRLRAALEGLLARFDHYPQVKVQREALAVARKALNPAQG